MIKDFPTFTRPAVLCLTFWAFVFSLAVFPQIDNEFSSYRQTFPLERNGITKVLFSSDRAEGILLNINVPTADPKSDPIYSELSIHVNGHEINLENSHVYFRRQQIIWITPSSYYNPGKDNEIVIKLPKPSPKDNPNINTYLTLYNYRYISPNTPIIYVAFDYVDDSGSMVVLDVLYRFLQVYLITFSSFLIFQVILSRTFFQETSKALSAFNGFYIFAVLWPCAFSVFGFATPYKVIFPTETIFWLTLISFLLFCVVGIVIFGAIFPKVNEVLLPRSSRAKLFPRKVFLDFHELIAVVVEKYQGTWSYEILLAVMILIPAAIFWYGVIKYSINLAYFDDLITFTFIAGMEEAQTFAEKLHYLLGRHNEHLVLFYRLSAWILFSINGEINFRVAAILGSLSMIILLILFYMMIPKSRYRLLCIVPLVPFILSLNTWKLVINPINPLSNYYVLCFAGAALWCLNKRGNIFFCAGLFLAFFAAFSQASGILLFASGQLFLIYKKNHIKGAIWFLFGLICVFYYLDGFHSNSPPPYVAESEFTILNFLLFYFSFMGSAFSFGQFSYSVASGLVLFGFFVYLTLKKYFEKNPVIYFFMLFIAIVGLAVAFGRTEFGIQSALSQRYQMNSAVMIALIYLSIQELFLNKNVKQKIIVSAYLILLVQAHQLVSIPANKRDVEQKRLNYVRGMQKSFNFSHGVSPVKIDVADGVIMEALRKKRYYLPCREMFPERTIDHAWCK
jgi:hypothetical protein